MLSTGTFEHLRFRAVDVEVVLRRRRAERAVDLLHDAAAVARCNHLERALLERFETPAGAILQHHLEAARVADAAHGRRLDDEYLRVLNLCEARPIAAARSREPYRRPRAARTARVPRKSRRRSKHSQTWPPRTRRTLSNDPRTRRPQHDVGRAPHDRVRSRERRALRQLDDHDHVALVLLRDETLRHDAKQDAVSARSTTNATSAAEGRRATLQTASA